MATPDVQNNLQFVDTNVIVYAFDTANAEKHAKANALVADLIREGRLCISVQVLHEFYAVITRPNRPYRLDPSKASQIVSDFIDQSNVVSLTPSITLSALEVVGRHSISFWDALIWSSAKQAGCCILYSEDFQSDRKVDGVTYVNPFAS